MNPNLTNLKAFFLHCFVSLCIKSISRHSPQPHTDHLLGDSHQPKCFCTHWSASLSGKRRVSVRMIFPDSALRPREVASHTLSQEQASSFS